MEILSLLIERDADVNMKDASGWSPIRLAIKIKAIDIIKLLVQSGANVHSSDGSGWTRF